MNAQMGAIKLAMAGTKDWWLQFHPLLGYWLECAKLLITKQ